MGSVRSVPFPPLHLANRVGSLADQADPLAAYEAMGAGCKDSILRVLPSGWQWKDKAVLDLGCGAGRLLRHFRNEATETRRFCGCDIDRESIDWLAANLSPPFEVACTSETPPLPWTNGTFDLIFGVSIFTHITDRWPDWLLEVHRLLAPGGLALLTFIGKGCYHVIAGEPWDPDRIGMNTICHGNSWTWGGPMVFHSSWWIREHWGRLFEVVDMREEGFGAAGPVDTTGGQGTVLLRKAGGPVPRAALERVDPREPRELRALQHNLLQLQRESTELRHQLEETASRQARTDAVLAAVTAERDYMRDSVSWHATAPLRSLRGLLRSSR
jgi:SAM-dependent methyltransferase